MATSRLGLLLLGYCLFIGAIFLWVFYFWALDGLSLYVFLVLLNAPLSFLVVPWFESVAVALGFGLGGVAHVVLTQFTCMMANMILIWVVSRIIGGIRMRPLQKYGILQERNGKNR